MKMKKKTKLNFIILFLVIILTAVLFMGIKKEHALIVQTSQQTYNLGSPINYNSDKYNSVYNKIKANENVKILLLGDELTSGLISDNSTYPVAENLSSFFKTTYNINCDFQYLQQKDATIINGFQLLDSNPDLKDFDLVILSFGLKDAKDNSSLKSFAQNYSDLIGKLKSRNYNCLITALLPPSLNNDNEYVSEMKHICSSNNISYADTNNYFEKSDAEKDSLIVNNLPTSSGYDLVVSSICNLIRNNIYLFNTLKYIIEKSFLNICIIFQFVLMLTYSFYVANKKNIPLKQ